MANILKPHTISYLLNRPVCINQILTGMLNSGFIEKGNKRMSCMFPKPSTEGLGNHIHSLSHLID